MTTSIEQLKAEVSLRGGTAKNNLWRVVLPSLGVYESSSINLVCRSAVTPGRNINVTELPIGMSKKSIANGYAVGDVSMTFMVLNDPYILEYFEAWQSRAIDQQTYEVGYYRDYTFDIRIDVLKKGFSFPILKKNFDVPLPNAIKNRLPTIGPFNFAQGELELNALTDDKIVYSYELIDAFPVAFTGMNLVNDPGGQLLELNVTFNYRDWRSSGRPDKKGENIFGEILDNLTGGIFG